MKIIIDCYYILKTGFYVNKADRQAPLFYIEKFIVIFAFLFFFVLRLRLPKTQKIFV